MQIKIIKQDTGGGLGQDTETTLPEFPGQHKIREREEELHGLESVHMAEPETKCTAPGLNTLEPECVTANSRVSDLHHTEASLIKTETDLSPSNTGDLKTESLDFTDLAYVTHLHPDQIKIETDDGYCVKAEHFSDLTDIECVVVKSEEVKLESTEVLVSDVTNAEVNGAGVDEKCPRESWQCAGEPDLDSRKAGYEQSELIQDKGIFVGKKPYKCDQCEKSFPWKSHLKSHLCSHSGEKPFKCDQCEKSFLWKSHLESHRSIHSGEKPYKCDQCEKSFLWQCHLKSHLSTHTGEKPYKCNWCEKSFLRKSYFKSHQRIHTGEKPYKCDQCGMCFNFKNSLHSHEQTHTDKKPYKCDQCGKSFLWKSHLKSHVSIHTGEKPYKCDLCEKSFSWKCHLKSHLSIHSGEMPYKCDQCERSFLWKSHLESHRSMHTGEKPHKCDQCEKRFRHKSTLQCHERVHTGEKPYKCNHCEKSFAQRAHLDAHWRIQMKKLTNIGGGQNIRSISENPQSQNLLHE